MKHDSYQIGFRVLGPIFESYCFKLWTASLIRKDDCALLFLARGGFQLKRFYQRFLEKYNLEAPVASHKFYISRIAAYKAGLAIKDEYSIDKIVENYRWETIEQAFRSMLPSSVYSQWSDRISPQIKLAFSENHFNRSLLSAVLEGKYDENMIIKSYLDDQLALVRKQVTDLSPDKKLVLLADTGWSGTILGSLVNIVQDRELVGLFFGKSSYGKTIGHDYFQDIVGLEVEAGDYHYRQPKSVIFLYRHLIESICEVAWPSVNGLSLEQDRVVSEDYGEFVENFTDEQPLLNGIMDYLSVGDKNPKLSQSSIFESALSAYKTLFTLISFPNSNTVSHLRVADRSADLGKEFSVPILLPKAEKFTAKVSNLKNSLWVPGQLVVEFENRMILRLCQVMYLVNKHLKYKI